MHVIQLFLSECSCFQWRPESIRLNEVTTTHRIEQLARHFESTFLTGHEMMCATSRGFFESSGLVVHGIIGFNGKIVRPRNDSFYLTFDTMSIPRETATLATLNVVVRK